MNLILINGKIKNVNDETERSMTFTFTVDKEITKECDCHLIFRVAKQSAKEKLRKLLTPNTELLIEGSIENHPKLPTGITITVKKFHFLKSLQEKLEESFMTFDELNSILEEEIEKYLKEERNYQDE